jgi:hypothetical protein
MSEPKKKRAPLSDAELAVYKNIVKILTDFEDAVRDLVKKPSKPQ